MHWCGDEQMLLIYLLSFFNPAWVWAKAKWTSMRSWFVVRLLHRIAG